MREGKRKRKTQRDLFFANKQYQHTNMMSVGKNEGFKQELKNQIQEKREGERQGRKIGRYLDIYLERESERNLEQDPVDRERKGGRESCQRRGRERERKNKSNDEGQKNPF